MDIRKSANEFFDNAKETALIAGDKATDMFDTASEVAGDVFGNASVKGREIGKRAKLKASLVDQGLEYDSLMKKLGHAVYERVKADPSFADCSDLFDKIEKSAQRRYDLEEQLVAAEGTEDAAADEVVVEAEPVVIVSDQADASTEDTTEDAQ